ncbi:two-component sensor histidine kinase [Agaricicola taiwanensis]|uniref:histidine kinase n=1 Tax=Agaricicola taiwanensis TaxID=591372 RepID=A0A8J2VN77_9RHOB|nr:ATP-binding protein [Agaricicola taiwanensis]GGE39664.1 two-component sensor histidine kinase [Agaricicola taiwanensis]
MTSIRRRLVTILLATTSAVWLFAVAWIYASTQEKVGRVLDARLAEAARMVSSLIDNRHVDVAAAVDAAMQIDPGSFFASPRDYDRQLSCQIWSLQGDLIGRSESAPVISLADHSDGFAQTDIGGERWRVYAVVNAELGVRVLVGDSLEIRERLIGDVVKGLLFPTIFILPLLAILIWLSVGHGLEPLNRIAASLTGRAATDLHPVDHGVAPREVQPIVTSLNSLFDRVREARERERNFTVFAAHEMKTPLAGLKTQAQIAIRSNDSEVQRKALSHIVTSVDRTSRMARQLIDMAAVDAAEPGRVLEDVDVQALISDVAVELEGPLELAKARFVLTAAPGNGAQTITADRLLLRLVLRNILENAIQHTPEHGEVMCELSFGEGVVTIAVHDQGPGIDPADQERVKERFVRTSSANLRGSGLGLSIVQMGLDRLGGSLSFSNADSGFTVAVHLPSKAEV